MENTLTVTEVSRTYGVSARMLRHYEKLGLIGSDRKEDYAYRVYRPEDIRRLRQILVLRKLRLPLKEIGAILLDPGPAAAISVFEKNLSQMDEEIRSIQAVRSVIDAFLQALRQRQTLPAGEVILQDSRLLALADALSPAATLIQEERRKIMEHLKQADQASQKLKDVRIVHLPESNVAAAHFVGDDPESRAGEMISEFVRREKLWEKHPGLRLYGFNHPSPADESGYHGYEFWITIPDGMEVKPPLQKKRFAGGTYAAHMIPMGNFEEWEWLNEWVHASDEYEYAGNGSPENMFDALEEHLNYHDHILETREGEPQTAQLDLLLPVRRKAK
ncbi:MAG: effector binding domain-containing protein [Clostridia bacterium]|nr:effector binding domain-containing protein [Clostridia bacterium]